MRSVAVLTVSRADYGIYVPVLREIQHSDDLELQLIVGGTHLSPEFGSTIDQVLEDGFPIAARVPMVLSSDTAEGAAMSMGLGTIGFAQTFQRLDPDIILVLGDRSEMHCGVVAALPFRIPVAHIAGGEITEGALDDSLRHSISKLSHVHFVSLPEYAERLALMGEEPWRIHVTGSPSLDHLSSFAPVPKDVLEKLVGISLDVAPLILTLHPETLASASVDHQVGSVLEALDRVDFPVLVTAPNADAGGREVMARLRAWVSRRSDRGYIANMGTTAYYSLMGIAAAMVGNSSSGIVEAASFRLPVVNIGDRQKGRPHPENIVDVPSESEAIESAIRKATSPEFQTRIAGLVNPFGDGHASERIVGVLSDIQLNDGTLIKRFYERVG